ncbi:MAG: hypothetical protein AB7P99_18635 [Vicinamibacterales bacterium]
MRRLGWCAAAVAGLLGHAAGPVAAQDALPGTDIGAWASAAITSRLSLVSTWRPLDTNAQFVGPFWSTVKVGPEQREAVALGGWVYNAFFGGPTAAFPDATPTRAMLLVQQADGTLVDGSQEVLGETATNGVGSVITGDFNGDGRQDVMFVAHNESPTIGKSSVAFLSQSDGSLRRLMVGDSVAGHDAQLYRVNGRDGVLVRSLGNGIDAVSATYQIVWNGTGFTVTRVSQMRAISGVAGPFAGDARQFVVGGDVSGGPGLTFDAARVKSTTAWELINGTTMQPLYALPAPYFDARPEYAAFESFFAPSKTHTVGLISVDLNQDGLLDIVTVSTLWRNGANGHQKGAYQVLLNRGGMRFTDDTDALGTEFSHDSVIDYSAQFIDVDASGIETFFTASHLLDTPTGDEARQGNYILVNDGTGHLYAAMHAEFRSLGAQVTAFVNARLGRGNANEGITPQFVPYRTADGTLNFVAVVDLAGRAQVDPARLALVNVPVGVNLTTDFRRDMTVPGRNGSRRIRTFAGNDTIARALADPDCTIDGGLGTDVVVYPGSMHDWSLQREGSTVLVSHKSGAGGTDRLTRVEIARFDDGDVPLAE